MSYGLRIVNAGGIVQIDADYSNFVVTSRVVPVPWQPGDPIPDPGLYDPPADGIRLEWHDGSGNVAEFAFARPASALPASSASYGLRVWRGDASLAFDSGHTYLYPVAGISVPVTGESVFLSLPPSPRRRFVLSSALSDIAIVNDTSVDIHYFIQAISHSNDYIEFYSSDPLGPSPAPGLVTQRYCPVFEI